MRLIQLGQAMHIVLIRPRSLLHSSNQKAQHSSKGGGVHAVRPIMRHTECLQGWIRTWLRSHDEAVKRNKNSSYFPWQVLSRATIIFRSGATSSIIIHNLHGDLLQGAKDGLNSEGSSIKADNGRQAWQGRVRGLSRKCVARLTQFFS